MRCYIHVCMLHPPGSAYVYTLQGCISHHTLACSLHLMAQASWVLELLSPVGKRRQKGAKIAHLIGFQTQKCKSIQSSTSNCNQKKKHGAFSTEWDGLFDGREFFIPLFFFSPMMEKEKTLTEVMNTGTTCPSHECSTEFSRALWLNTALP